MKAWLDLIEKVTTVAAEKTYAKQGRRTPKGYFKAIALAVEMEYGIALGTLRFKTATSRILSGNLSGKHAGRQPPIHDLEPLI
jgi:hypothetical protein